MSKTKIAITLDEQFIEQLDRLVSENVFQNRSQAIQEAVDEKLKRLKRTRLAKECSKLDAAFEKVDCIIGPTSPVPAFKIGERANNPLEMYLSDIYTIPANLAGIPGISIPCGFSKDGLPIGLQILTKHFEEKQLLHIAYSFERETDYHLKRATV